MPKKLTGGCWTTAAASGAVLASWLCSAPAFGQQVTPEPEVDARVSGGSLVDPGLNRPFLFFVDPSLPAQGHAIFGAGLGSITRTGEERSAGSGALIPTFSAEVGLLSHLSIYAAGEFVFDEPGQSVQTNFALEVGAHLLLTDPQSQNVRVALLASFGSDFSGATRMQLNAVASWDLGHLRLAGSVTGSHDFVADADAIDMNGVLAASYLLPLSFRLGAEMIGQDLEEIWTAQAEGGASVFAGPTLGWEFAHRFEIVAGPMFGLTNGSSQILARGAASILF